MAIREIKGRALPWQVYWNNPYTKKRECEAFETRQEAEEKDSLIKYKLRFERESFQFGAKDGPQETMTLEALYILYLKEKQFPLESAANQLTAMRTALRLYGSTPIKEIGQKQIQAVLDAHMQSGNKPVTVTYRMKKLKTLLLWAEKKGYCKAPTFPELPKARYEKFRPPTSRELEAMLVEAPEHIKRVIIIGSQCGVRVGPCELFSLTWADVDFDRKILLVHGSHKNPNAPWREVPIRESLIPRFRAWHEAVMKEKIQYLIHYKGKPVKSINDAWRATMRRAFIERRIRPYDLRHAFATELIAAGVDIGTVAKLMGHSGPTMLLTHYQYVMDRQKREAVENLPELSYVPKMCPREPDKKPYWSNWPEYMKKM